MLFIRNEMFPNQTSYVEEGRTGPQHRPLFRIGVHVCGLTFHGWSHTKQKARQEAAKEAIAYFTATLETNPRFSYEVSDRYDYYYYRRRPYLHRYQPYNRGEGYDKRWGGAVPHNQYDRSHRPSHRPDYHFYESHYASRQNREYYPVNYPLFYRNRAHIPVSAVTESNESAPNVANVGQYATAVTTITDSNNSGSKSDIKSDLRQIEGKRNDFTVDDYNDSFVEFNEKGDNREDSTEPMAAEVKCDQTSKPKERIILRIMSETPVNQNPVSVIHELQPNAKWVCTELTTKKHSTTFEMRLLLPLANQCFIGTAKTKKLAKAEAAAKALLQLYNISVNNQNSDSSDPIKPKSTVQIAQEPLLLKQVTLGTT